MEFTGNDFVSLLTCDEDCMDLDAQDTDHEYNAQHQTTMLLKDSALFDYETDFDDDEYVESLFLKERICCFDKLSNSSMWTQLFSSETTENWFATARSNSIEWILKTRVLFGFSFKTAYLAATYMDCFFARRTIDVINDNGKLWAVKLASIACLSLAAKMEECRVPAPSEFEFEEYRFDSRTVQRMEFLVLDTLEWRMNLVTPFEYIKYFTLKFKCDDRSNDFLHRIVRYIFASFDVIDLVHYRASTVAAAAILAASSERFNDQTLESKLGSVSHVGNFDKGEVDDSDGSQPPKYAYGYD